MTDTNPASEHPNAILARALWQATADGDAEAIGRCLSDGVVWTSMGRNPLSGQHVGPEGVIEYLADVGEAADELRSALEGVYVNATGAVVLYHVSARRGAARLEMDYLLLLRIEDGLVTRGLMVAVDQARNDEFWD